MNAPDEMLKHIASEDIDTLLSECMYIVTELDREETNSKTNQYLKDILASVIFLIVRVKELENEKTSA